MVRKLGFEPKHCLSQRQVLPITPQPDLNWPSENYCVIII